MIRVRAKKNGYTIRIDGEKQRVTSAIHALHIVRMAVKDGHRTEDEDKTYQALLSCIEQSRQELRAAECDVTEAMEETGKRVNKAIARSAVTGQRITAKFMAPPVIETEKSTLYYSLSTGASIRIVHDKHGTAVYDCADATDDNPITAWKSIIRPEQVMDYLGYTIVS